MNDEMRHKAVTELAERILKVAEEAYARAPKIVVDTNDPDPPPLSFHVAFTSAQFAEALLRLLVLRKIQVVAILSGEDPPEGFEKVLMRCDAEANRMLKFFEIELAQEI